LCARRWLHSSRSGALSEDDAALEARGHVSRTASGPFAREPQLARLLEEGLSLGYDLVSYQVADACTDCRHIDAITRDAEAQAGTWSPRRLPATPTPRSW
jgi:hypothetical protein